MHSRPSSIYRAAQEWLDSFDDSDVSSSYSDDDMDSIDSSLGQGYFLDTLPEADTKSYDAHAGMNRFLALYGSSLAVQAKSDAPSTRRRPQQSVVLKKETVDKRMSGDV